MQHKTKIIFTVTNSLVFDQRMQRICNSLHNHQFNVLLVGRKLNNTPKLQANYQTHLLNCWFKKGVIFYLEFNIKLLFFLLKTNADIYCAIDLDTILPNTLVAKLKGKKLFFDAHEYFTETPEVTNRKLVKIIWQLTAKYCIKYTDKCYTVGSELAKIFTAIYKKPFAVIKNVPAFFEPKNTNTFENKIILYQGALNKSRGIEQAILAMQKVEGAVLHIAGEGDLSAELRLLVKANNLQQKVKFLGFIKPELLKEITQNCTIGLNLLENNGLSYYYSLANKFFDYIMAGKPQICANFPEYENLNKQFNIAILANCKVDEIANAINQLLNNNNLYNHLKQNCLKAAKTLNWQHQEQELISIFKNI